MACQAGASTSIANNIGNIARYGPSVLDGSAPASPDAPYFFLHIRQNLLDTLCQLSAPEGRASLQGSGHHVAQTQQIRRTTVRPPVGKGNERVGVADVRPLGRHRGQRAAVVVIEDPVLTPRLAHRDELERPPRQRMEGMRDANNSMRSVGINCS